jgi:uncharacterized membrane protein
LATWTKNSTTARHATDGTTFLLRVCVAVVLSHSVIFFVVVVFFWFHHFQSHRIRSENNNNFLLDELILAFDIQENKTKKRATTWAQEIRTSFSLFSCHHSNLFVSER